MLTSTQGERFEPPLRCVLCHFKRSRYHDLLVVQFFNLLFQLSDFFLEADDALLHLLHQ